MCVCTYLKPERLFNYVHMHASKSLLFAKNRACKGSPKAQNMGALKEFIFLDNLLFSKTIKILCSKKIGAIAPISFKGNISTKTLNEVWLQWQILLIVHFHHSR